MKKNFFPKKSWENLLVLTFNTLENYCFSLVVEQSIILYIIKIKMKMCTDARHDQIGSNLILNLVRPKAKSHECSTVI